MEMGTVERSRIFGKFREVFLGNVLNAVLGFAGTIILSRLLSVEDFGKFGYLLAFSIIAVTVLDFASGTAFVIHFNKQHLSNSVLRNYNAIRAATLALMGFAGLLLLIVPFGSYATIEKLFILTLISSSLISMHYQFYYQGLGEYRKLVVMTVLLNFVRLLLILGIVLLHTNKGSAQLAVVFKALIGAQIISTAAIFYLVRNDANWSVSFNFDKEYLRTMAYLGLGSILIIITMRIDVFIIKHFLDYQHVGYYQVVFTLCSIFPLLTGSLMTVLVREFSVNNMTGSDIKMFMRKQLRLLIPGIIITLVVIVLARPLIELVFGNRFEPSIPLLQVMVIPFLLGVVFTPLESFFYSHRPNIVTLMKFVQMSATILFSIIFIRAFGLIGAGYSTLLVRIIGWIFLVVNAFSFAAELKSQGNGQASIILSDEESAVNTAREFSRERQAAAKTGEVTQTSFTINVAKGNETTKPQ